MNTFTWLLKREYWENRGGFNRTPVIAASIILAIFAVAIVWAETVAARHGIHINSLNLSELTQKLAPEKLPEYEAALKIALLALSVPMSVILSFVLFFYLLGSLYDERRDRSILFWKSLPVSDTSTVLSKVVTATVVAPLISLAATFALILGFLVLLSIYVAFKGINPFTMIWMHTSLPSVFGKLLMMLPINALWAMPTIGWLMLCSVFAKRVPFLWATLIPVGFAIATNMFNVILNTGVAEFSVWKHVVFRLLASVFPGMWADNSKLEQLGDDDSPVTVVQAMDVTNMLDTLGSANLWLGVLAGSAMIAAAIWLRRSRDES